MIDTVKFEEIIATIEHFGIYQRFECIKCDRFLGNINLAMAHLRGEYLNCIEAVEAPKIETKREYNKKEKRNINVYSEEDKNYIMKTKQNAKYLARRFNTTVNNVIKLKYRWKKEKKESSKDHSDYIKSNRNKLKPSTEYKIEPAEEQ